MKSFVVFLCFFMVGVCFGEFRDPRWFNRQTRTVTKVLKFQHVVTEATPSSCVVVQTSLPPCRHLRGLPIHPAHPTRIQPTIAPHLQKQSADQPWKPIMHPSDPIPPSLTPSKINEPIEPSVSPSGEWNWDIFNLRQRDVTVTKTIQEVFTTKYYDPNTVVTFSVKGCRPSRLPFDLPECKLTDIPPEPIPDRNVIVMAPVEFVPEHVISSFQSDIKAAKPEEPPKDPEVMKDETQSS